LLLPCGENVIRFSPPLVISSEEVDTAVEIFREVISQYEKKRKVI
jgi:4-aminobutyrate aminotransferase